MNAVDVDPDAQVPSVWHRRLRHRKSCSSLPAEPPAMKEETSATLQKQHPHVANGITCSTCGDGVSFAPAELTMHFQVVHGGEGSPPAFSALQRHLRHNHDCHVCNDDVQRTLAQLTEHCQTLHSLNGRYYCSKCHASFKEIKPFLSHWRAHEEPVRNPAQENHLLKHMAQRWSRRNWWRTRALECKKELPEPQRTPGFPDTRGLFLDPEKTLEETRQFLERTSRLGNNWPSFLKREQQVALAGLMEKNNIFVPQDCTTEVVGFKTVDGRKHLVLKVVPSSKGGPQESGKQDAADASFQSEPLTAAGEKITSQDVSGFSGSPSSRCEDGELVLHGRDDERTNNPDPREAPVPLDQTRPPAPEEPAVAHLLDEATEPSHGSPGSGATRPDRRRRLSSGNQPPSTSSTASSRSEESASPSDSRTPPTGGDVQWEPVPRDAATTLRLVPYGSSVGVPQGDQPVIVLNHPDSDIPEVVNIMRLVHKHKGAVTRVVLSRRTLSELRLDSAHRPRAWPNGTVQERFSLKLRLRRVRGRKYTVLPPAAPESATPTFTCWFCGRVFRNQEAWVGHGQRHLMEATRGWNQLFSRPAGNHLRDAR